MAIESLVDQLVGTALAILGVGLAPVAGCDVRGNCLGRGLPSSGPPLRKRLIRHLQRRAAVMNPEFCKPKSLVKREVWPTLQSSNFCNPRREDLAETPGALVGALAQQLDIEPLGGFAEYGCCETKRPK